MSTASPRRLDARDVGWIALVLALLAAYVWRTFDWALPLYEDAAILMRYARHMAEGHGIVWNVGEPPVDGATDFLLMATTAAIARLGTSVEAATLGLGLASHALTIVVVYAGVRRLHGGARWMAAASAAFLAFGPGIRYVEAYFGTPYFGLYSATTWYLATSIRRFGESNARAAGLAISGLLLGLTRPEGVFLAAFMLGAVVVTSGWRASRRSLAWFAGVFLVLGGAYFVWRWRHFGYPLPNTYYIKGGKTVHWGHLRGGLRHLMALSLPLVPLLGACVAAECVARWRRAGARWSELVFVATPIVLFTLLGVLHEGLMDYLHRFQYCLLPILLIGWPPLVRRLCELLGCVDTEGLRRSLWGALAGLFVLGALAYQVRTFPTGGHRWWGTYNVAQILAEYPTSYTVAVTNAGHLPYVSRWRAVDGWGLNDQRIAHEGLSEELLDEYRPEVIQFDAGYSPIFERGEANTPWGQATRVMHEYALANGYVLAAAFGVTPYKAHYYYVRSDFPESDELVRRIRAVPYFIGGSPTRCLDFSAPGRGEPAANF